MSDAAYSVQVQLHGNWSEVACVASRDAAMSIAKQNRKYGDKVRIVKRSNKGGFGFKYPTQTAERATYR